MRPWGKRRRCRLFLSVLYWEWRQWGLSPVVLERIRFHGAIYSLESHDGCGRADDPVAAVLCPFLSGRTAHDQQRPGHRNPVLGFFNAILKIYVTVIRGTPMMVQLMIMGLVIFASSRDFVMVGALTLGINSGAYTAEIIRGGLMSVDQGQMEAGRSLGMNYTDTMRFVIIPQAIKAILPALGNEFIVLLKDTSLISVIGGKELLYAARSVASRNYEPMYPYVGAAIVYLLLVLLFTWLLGIFERRLRASDRR